MKLILIACLIAFSFSSCYDLEELPAPTISFTAKPNGEGNVTFDVSTTDAETFHWDFGDGNFSDEKFPTHTYENNGIYKVTLSAEGPDGEAMATEQITVNDITGSAVFWLSALRTMEIEVYVDGQYYGKITRVAPTEVFTCGADYAVTANNLSEGAHLFTANELNTASPARWMGVVEISGRKCKSMGLTTK